MPVYCSWDAGALQRLQAFASSGSAQIDNAMIAELKKILNVIPINPGFKFIADPSPNAFAVQESIVAGTQGTVYIGLNLINSEFYRSETGGVAVAGICAHECGHIYQFQNGYREYLASTTAKLMELHADFIAGLYLGRDKSHSKQQVEVFAQSLFSRGDYGFNTPSHHGTPQQRVAAMRRGYEVGQTNVTIPPAIRTGADFVRAL
jgi:hypothetical protein